MYICTYISMYFYIYIYVFMCIYVFSSVSKHAHPTRQAETLFLLRMGSPHSHTPFLPAPPAVGDQVMSPSSHVARPFHSNHRDD